MRSRKEVAAYINAGGKGFEMKHMEKSQEVKKKVLKAVMN